MPKSRNILRDENGITHEIRPLIEHCIIEFPHDSMLSIIYHHPGVLALDI
ncbi:hypothetical protein AYX15_07145 [Cryptococcus neoformans]|nr:hypothetical protein AYX15_07145 [Cryptococcus neoformans var. grubii]